MPTPDSGAPKQRVLVAEDVRATADLITWVLEDAGFEVEVALDGESCLEKVRSFRPDLVVLDIMLPKLHGIDVVRRLKSDEATRHIAVILCTGKDFRTERKRAIELGVDGLVIKPFEPRELLAAVEGILRTGGAGRTPFAPEPKREAFDTGALYLPHIDLDGGRLRFWGTRGSIPICGPDYMRHGGNTCCVELEHGGELIVLDAGSGIRELGNQLAAGEPRRLHLFITHTHWDHIQGFPFFTPAFIPGFEIVVYAARGFNKDIESLFRGQLDPDYFPIQMDNMEAHLEFRYLGDEPVRIGAVEVTWEFTQHPGPTVGYRLETPGQSVAFVPDNEAFQGYMGPPAEVEDDRKLLDVYRPLLAFLDGVDVLVHEAQFMPNEYRHTVHFGHSSVPNACALVKMVRPNRWIIIHHDPNHSDEFLDVKLQLTRQLMRELGSPLEVVNGYDGMVEYL